MKYARALAFAAVAGVTIVTATGCSVARNQQTMGAYVDDASMANSDFVQQIGDLRGWIDRA